MPADLKLDMSQAQEYIKQLEAGVDEPIIEKALQAESDILAKRMATEAPRLNVDRKWKNRSRKHMQDDMRVSPLTVAGNGAYYMSAGPQLKPGDGHAYAPLVNDGTARIKANDFMGRTLDAVEDEAVEAAMDELRKGLGIGG